MELKFKGEELTRSELSEILQHFIITNHAIKRLDERTNILTRINDRIDFRTTIRNIKRDINSNLLISYFNTDGTVNVAIDLYHYYVFENRDNCWILKTFKEKSWNGITILDKRLLAQQGKEGFYRYGG